MKRRFICDGSTFVGFGSVLGEKMRIVCPAVVLAKVTHVGGHEGLLVVLRTVAGRVER